MRLKRLALLSVTAAVLAVTPPSAFAQKPETTRDRPISFSTVSAGNRFTCGISSDSIAYCWGYDHMGQLGIDEIVGRCAESKYAKGPCARAPVKVFGDHRFVSISTGFEHACAIDRAGDVYCWGENHFDQIGVPYVTDFCRDDSMTMACSRRPLRVQIGAPLVAVGTGEYFTCALDRSGRAWCWGGVPSPTRVPLDQPLTALSVGLDQACGLTVDKGIRCWKWRDVLTDGATVPSTTNVWTALTVGAGHACALAAGGEAYCWGNDADGALGIGPNPHDSFHEFPMTAVVGNLRFRSIVTGETQTCGIVDTGALYCWGRVAEGIADDQCLDSNGIAGTNDCVTRPRAVHGKYRFRSLSIGARHQCAITLAGETMCWGTNEAGQLGDGTLRPTANLTAVRTLGVSSGQLRVIDTRARIASLARNPVLLILIVILVGLFLARHPLRAWWQAGSLTVATAGKPTSRGGVIALGALVVGWSIFGMSLLSVGSSDVHGDVGYGLAMMALVYGAGIAAALAAIALVIAVLTLRRHGRERAAVLALVLSVLTLLAGAALAALLFWPRER